MSRRKTDAQGDAAAGAETRMPQGETEPGQAGALPAGENAMDLGNPAPVEREDTGQPAATEGGAGPASVDETGAPLADAGLAAAGEETAGDGGDGTTISAIDSAASGEANGANPEPDKLASYSEGPLPLTPSEQAYLQRMNILYQFLEGPAAEDDPSLYFALFEVFSSTGVIAHLAKSLPHDIALLSLAECIEAADLIRRIGHARATAAVIGQHLKLAGLRKSGELDGPERVAMEIFAFTLATLDSFAKAEEDRRAAAEAVPAERKKLPIEETIFEPTDDLDARTY